MTTMMMRKRRRSVHGHHETIGVDHYVRVTRSANGDAGCCERGSLSGVVARVSYNFTF